MSPDDQKPIYKKSFKFLLEPGANEEKIWKKFLSILEKNRIKVEVKS